jgi:hypothetical protein
LRKKKGQRIGHLKQRYSRAAGRYCIEWTFDKKQVNAVKIGAMATYL